MKISNCFSNNDDIVVEKKIPYLYQCFKGKKQNKNIEVLFGFNNEEV